MNVVEFAKDLFDPWCDSLVAVSDRPIPADAGPGIGAVRGFFHIDGHEYVVVVQGPLANKPKG